MKRPVKIYRPLIICSHSNHSFYCVYIPLCQLRHTILYPLPKSFLLPAYLFANTNQLCPERDNLAFQQHWVVLMLANPYHASGLGFFKLQAPVHPFLQLDFGLAFAPNNHTSTQISFTLRFIHVCVVQVTVLVFVCFKQKFNVALCNLGFLPCAQCLRHTTTCRTC